MFRILCAGGIALRLCAAEALIFTAAPRFDFKTSERFPAGAQLQVLEGDRPRALVPGFAASADAAVSFDGKRVLFSGKRKAGEPWQVWEVAVSGGVPRRITSVAEDSIRPFYLPDDRIVYARRTPRGFQLEIVPLAGGAPLRLTYAPGDHITCDVLRDGRVLFEAPHPGAPSAGRDLYAVYTDGSGVETHRCDHGRDRFAGRELASGDIVFQSGARLARFTSARAGQVEILLPKGEFAGPLAELGAEEWLVCYRAAPPVAFGLYRLKLGGTPVKVVQPQTGHAVQPVVVRPHAVPPRHPSSLGARDGANLLCLNAYTSRARIPAGSIAASRVYTQDDAGASVLLGLAKVERDGSFFVQVPAERPLRFELIDAGGKVVQAEKGWFWARRGEQRVCVGCHAGPERAPDNASPEVLSHGTEPVNVMPAGGAR